MSAKLYSYNPKQWMNKLVLRARTASSERGGNLVEYALLLSLIVFVCITAIGSVGSATTDNMDDLASTLSP